MSLQGKEILIIDDVSDVRILCRKVLENLGMIVSEASSVKRALALLEDKTPHAILLDLQMPEQTGYDFLKTRAESAQLSAIPVIVLSTLGDKEAVHRSIALGANDYVLKPMNASLISQRVRKHVRGLDFKRLRFSGDKMPKLKVHVPAAITRIDETAFVLESPARIKRDTRLTLSPPVVDAIDLSPYLLMCDSDAGSHTMDGQHLTKVNVVGLSESIQKTLRKGGGP